LDKEELITERRWLAITARTYLMLSISILTDVVAVLTLPLKEVVIYCKSHPGWAGPVLEIGTILVLALLTVAVVELLSIVQTTSSVAVKHTDESIQTISENLQRGTHLYVTSLILYIIVEAILKTAL